MGPCPMTAFWCVILSEGMLFPCGILLGVYYKVTKEVMKQALSWRRSTNVET